VQKIAFTGSTAVGQRIVEMSAGNLKRVQLELGGKGANIIFEDASIPAAVNGAAFAIFHNQGQACIAGSRIILHESIASEFLERFVALATSIRVGDPLAPTTEMGPLTSPQHRDRVLSYVKLAVDEGAEIVTGGHAITEGPLAQGCYVEPTVVLAESDARVCQEEVFGPFATVTTFSDDDEAIAIANSTDYALGVACGRSGLTVPTVWPTASVPAWCGSTRTSASAPAHRSAELGAPDMAAKWVSKPCGNTRRPRASG